MEEGEFYHVYNRGNNRQPIFFEPKNYLYFLEKFEKYICPHTEVYAYCLMPNHFHFLLQVNTPVSTFDTAVSMKSRGSKYLTPIEKGFKDFFISYAKSINKAYHRTGSLFQSKFKRKLITDESYLTTIIPYIHLNPVRAGISKSLIQYQYSSFKKILEPEPSFLMRSKVISYFGTMNAFIHAHTTANDYSQWVNHVHKFLK